jgi:hypothetical protein
LSTKLTTQEAKAVEAAASRAGKTPSEWARDVILREAQTTSTGDPELAEILGVRLLLVNVLRPLAAGQQVTNEVFDKLLDEISIVKHQLASKLASGSGRK